jgi:hypothetical protein
MVLGKVDIHVHNNGIRQISHHIEKINAKWVKDLNVRHEITRRNHSANLCDIGLRSDFFGMTSKGGNSKQMELHQTKKEENPECIQT